MRTLEVKITNPNGLTSEHGADLVEEANLYKSNITMITSTSNDKADLKIHYGCYGHSRKRRRSIHNRKSRRRRR